MKKVVTILSPCMLTLAFCLISLVVSVVGFIKGDAFSDLYFVTFLALSILLVLIDLITKKLTNYRRAHFWLLQGMLLIGLFFLTRLIVGSMFSAFV